MSKFLSHIHWPCESILSSTFMMVSDIEIAVFQALKLLSASSFLSNGLTISIWEDFMNISLRFLIWRIKPPSNVESLARKLYDVIKSRLKLHQCCDSKAWVCRVISFLNYFNHNFLLLPSLRIQRKRTDTPNICALYSYFY